VLASPEAAGGGFDENLGREREFGAEAPISSRIRDTIRSLRARSSAGLRRTSGHTPGRREPCAFVGKECSSEVSWFGIRAAPEQGFRVATLFESLDPERAGSLRQNQEGGLGLRTTLAHPASL